MQNYFFLLNVHVHMKPANNASKSEETHLQTKNLGGGELVIFEALFRSLLCFQCS